MGCARVGANGQSSAMGSHCRNSTRAWRHTEAHREIDVPNLDFTGWYDHCGNADHFAGMRKNARTGEARRQTKIIIGPWNHCNLGARKQAGFDFGPDAEIDVCREQIRWFAPLHVILGCAVHNPCGPTL